VDTGHIHASTDTQPRSRERRITDSVSFEHHSIAIGRRRQNETSMYVDRCVPAGGGMFIAHQYGRKPYCTSAVRLSPTEWPKPPMTRSAAAGLETRTRQSGLSVR